jgi:hypothetical protein
MASLRSHESRSDHPGARSAQGSPVSAQPPQHLPISEAGLQFPGAVRATLWPTRSLITTERWFDELYVWTEGGAASTTQRARIQLEAMREGFNWLQYDLVERIGVTVSFGTIERALEPLSQLFEDHALLTHRMFVLLRGAPQRLRSRYRLRAFADMLRSQKIAVGYRITAPRVSMELAGVDLVQPTFAKVLAPTATRAEAWGDLALEVRALGIDMKSTIVGAIESRGQRELAVRAGFELGQGRAVKAPYPPPNTPLRD